MAQQIVDLASLWQLLVTFITGTIPDGRQASMDEGRLSMEATCMPSGPETDANTLPAWDQYFTEKKDVEIASREMTFRYSLASSCMQLACHIVHQRDCYFQCKRGLLWSTSAACTLSPGVVLLVLVFAGLEDQSRRELLLQIV